MYFLESRGPNNTKIMSHPIVALACSQRRQRWLRLRPNEQSLMVSEME